MVAQKQNGGKPTIITKRCLVSSPAQANVKKIKCYNNSFPFGTGKTENIECQWTYGQWSKCSVTCGVGTQRRQKILEETIPPGVDVRDFDYGGCEYENQFEERPCFGPPCTGTDSCVCLIYKICL